MPNQSQQLFLYQTNLIPLETRHFVVSLVNVVIVKITFIFGVISRLLGKHRDH